MEANFGSEGKRERDYAPPPSGACRWRNLDRSPQLSVISWPRTNRVLSHTEIARARERFDRSMRKFAAMAVRESALAESGPPPLSTTARVHFSRSWPWRLRSRSARPNFPFRSPPNCRDGGTTITARGPIPQHYASVPAVSLGSTGIFDCAFRLLYCALSRISAFVRSAWLGFIAGSESGRLISPWPSRRGITDSYQNDTHIYNSLNA